MPGIKTELIDRGTLGGIQFSQKGLMTGPELVDGRIEFFLAWKSRYAR